jgi:ABC-type glycerol-3-phosphate transport system permease component
MVFSGGIVPSYIIISRYLKLSNNILVLIIPMLVNVFNVYLLRTFFQNIPTSIIEAAKIDGMSDIYIFFKICMPLSITGVVTVGLFTALGYWNDWWYNFLYITDGNIVNLQYMLYKVMANANFILQFPDKAAKVVDRMDIPAMSLRMATCILAAGPMTIAFMFLQKYFIRGITAGAVKG